MIGSPWESRRVASESFLRSNAMSVSVYGRKAVETDSILVYLPRPPKSYFELFEQDVKGSANGSRASRAWAICG